MVNPYVQPGDRVVIRFDNFPYGSHAFRGLVVARNDEELSVMQYPEFVDEKPHMGTLPRDTGLIVAGNYTVTRYPARFATLETEFTGVYRK